MGDDEKLSVVYIHSFGANPDERRPAGLLTQDRTTKVTEYGIARVSVRLVAFDSTVKSRIDRHHPPYGRLSKQSSYISNGIIRSCRLSGIKLGTINGNYLVMSAGSYPAANQKSDRECDISIDDNRLLVLYILFQSCQ